MRFGKLLPTMGVGSYATPGWLIPFREAMAAGRTGPADVAEAFDDATRIVVADQIEAGVDVISDGELRRQRFVYEMYDRLAGLERTPPARRLGVPGYDRAPHFVAAEPLQASDGLGLVEEYEALARLAPGRPLKIAFPGPLTFARNIEPGPAYGEGSEGRRALLADLVAILRGEVAALAAAGARLIQLDEPGLTNLPPGLGIEVAAEPLNEVAGAHAERCAVHVCYGNNASRPYARRDMARLLPALRALDVPMLLLEFANREMAEVELLDELSGTFEIAAGVIDVKSFHVESAEDVAARLRRVLEFVAPDRLLVTADCGFSAIPRWLARRKLQAMVEGAALVRDSL
ncbi:MAG TPA: cobalamin-independent methionine synthase II family protein [Alphaproteobacteria bacterium]|nr:cobalamin-independent methionine synthase II family protein [Alphaproteobacteria bacterium]